MLSLVAFTGCDQEASIEKFSSPEEQATVKVYVEHLRSHDFDEIEKALDPSIRTAGIRDTLTKMAALVPNEEPTSVKLVGVQTFNAPDAKTVNTTLEYNFGDKWLLANVAVQEKQGAKTIIGFNVYPTSQSLEAQNRFTLAGKSAIHYSVLTAAISAVLLTLYALVICARTRFPKRKWPWFIFILIGVGKLAVNWTTGEWSVMPLSVQVFSAGVLAPLYGPWTVAASLPLGAIVFLFYKKPRLEQALRGQRMAVPDARDGDGRGSA